MSKSAVILAGGKLQIEFATTYLKSHTFDSYIAADNGLSYMKQLGVMPDVVVGDFDTANADLVEAYKQQQNITMIRLKPEKDETDTESAIDYTIRMGYNEVVLLAAMGGRFDHTLANLHMLYRLLQHGIHAKLIDEYNCIYLIDGPYIIQKEALNGTYVSFLPFSNEVKNLSLQGFKYPLKDYSLCAGSSIGISNEAVESQCQISFTEGVLIVVEAHD